MVTPKALPFARVRVLESTESGSYRRVDDRRAGSGPRIGLPLPWRQPIRPLPAPTVTPDPTPAGTDDDLDLDLDPDAGGSATGPDRPQRRHDASEVGRGKLADPSTPADDGPDFPVIAPPRVERQPSEWLADTQAAAPIAAIARAVEESAALQSVAELVVRTCEGDGKRETGPWELTLPLQAHGLGRSRLMLRLSRELLGLRFECDGRDLRDLLWRHSKSLQARLEERLRIPLEIELELGDG